MPGFDYKKCDSFFKENPEYTPYDYYRTGFVTASQQMDSIIVIHDYTDLLKEFNKMEGCCKTCIDNHGWFQRGWFSFFFWIGRQREKAFYGEDWRDKL